MDLIIVFIALAIVIILCRRFSSFVYSIGIIDIFFRIVNYIKVELFKGKIYAMLDKVPASIPVLIRNYTGGIFRNVLVWLYVILMIIFEFYLIRNLFRRK